jgi:hypothetical protein
MTHACVVRCLALIALAFLLGLAVWVAAVPWWEWRQGEALAVEHWEAGFGYLFLHDTSPYTYRKGGLDFEQNYDRETGLRVEWMSFDRSREAWCGGYNSKMAELIRVNGDPP